MPKDIMPPGSAKRRPACGPTTGTKASRSKRHRPPTRGKLVRRPEGMVLLKARRHDADLLRIVLENMDEGIIVFSKESKVVAYNKRFIELLGFEDGVIRIGLSWEEVLRETARRLGAVEPGSVEQIIDARKRTYRQNFAMDELVFPDGTILAIRRRELPGGGFVSTFRDVTGRRLRAAKIHEALESLRKLSQTQTAILNALPSNVALLDGDAAIITVNESWRAFADRHRLAAGAAKAGGNYITACERASGPFSTAGAKVAKGVRAVLSGQKRSFSCQYSLVDEDGEHWFEMVSVPVGSSDIHGAIVVHTDITEQKLLQRDLISSEERQRAIVESSGDAILTLNDEGIIESVNTMTTAMVGCTNTAMIGKRVTDLLPAFPFFQPACGVIGQIPPLYHGEMMGVRADGSRFPTDVVMAMAQSPAGNFYVLNVRDITHNRTMQEELVQASKLATLGEMAAGMAHEANQPLNVIRMAADNAAMRLERGAAGNDYLLETLEGIGDQAEKLGKMILNLQIFARREDNNAKLDFLPTEAAGAACRLMRGQFKLDSISIVESYADPCRPVRGSGNQLEQVLINLLGNARDAILERRTETSSRARGKITVTIRDSGKGKWIEVEVEDNGSGIPDKVLDKIFNPFFTTKPVGKGTGLGLSVSHGIITSLKGSITAENTNTGARVKIKLPALPETEEAPPPRRHAHRTRGEQHIT